MFSLGESLKAIEIKVKINKWILIKLIAFCPTKEIIKKMGKKLCGWLGENICQQYDQQEVNYQKLQ